MTKAHKISVIVPCFNHGEFLPEAVGSVTRANRDDIELIVVDDGSTDQRTPKEMEKLAAQGIHVIRQANKGLAGARNAAIAASQGQYIFPLDADDRLCTGWIGDALRTLDSDERVGIVYGDAQCFGVRVGLWRTGAFDQERLLYWNCIHASALYRRSIWEQNGGYDSTMPMQGLEDWDFWLGALERGWRFEYLAQPFFEYRQTEGSMLEKTVAFEDEIEEFIARKHGNLYRQAWLDLVRERGSMKSTFRQAGRLVMSRIQRKSSDDGLGPPNAVFAKR